MVPRQFFAVLLDPFHCVLESGGNCDGRTLNAGHGGGFQNRALIRAKALDLFFDELSEIGRNFLLDV